jgi:hypothetical protein
LFLAKSSFYLFDAVLEINSGKNLTEVFMENKEFEKKPKTGSHTACKRARGPES